MPPRCDKSHEHQQIEGSVSIHGQRMSLTKFCASYCPGFARKVTSWMLRSLEQACVGEHEDAPPNKRSHFSFNPHKHAKVSHPIDLDSPQQSNQPAVDLDPEDADMPKLDNIPEPAVSFEDVPADRSKDSGRYFSAGSWFCVKSELAASSSVFSNSFTVRTVEGCL